jgi:hypothetical protein
MVHNEEEDNTFLFAIPSEVIVLEKGLLPDAQYRKIVERTPKLVSLASKP